MAASIKKDTRHENQKNKTNVDTSRDIPSVAKGWIQKTSAFMEYQNGLFSSERFRLKEFDVDRITHYSSGSDNGWLGVVSKNGRTYFLRQETNNGTARGAYLKEIDTMVSARGFYSRHITRIINEGIANNNPAMFRFEYKAKTKRTQKIKPIKFPEARNTSALFTV